MASKKKLKTYDKQREAVERYKESNPQKGIGTTFPRAEAEYIAATYKAHGVTIGEVIRGAAAALRDGQTIRTESAPLQVPTEYTAQPLPTSTKPTDTDTPTE